MGVDLAGLGTTFLNFFRFIYFLLKDNCFTEFCCFLSNLNMNFFFNVNHFFKSLLKVLQYSFYFMFWFFGCEACAILPPRPGIKPATSALEGEVLNTGPLDKSSGPRFERQ